jgi:tryptophan-rich sensory protein
VKDIVRAAAAVVFCELVGISGALFTGPAVDGWYRTLERPAFAPPNWVFGPAWTLLYALMGIAAYLVWKAPKTPARRAALAWFGAQLALNAIWSPVFFGLKNPGFALLIIVMMWAAIVATIAAFARVRTAAAWLLVPYLLWVSFATYLNYSFWALN